MIYIKKEDEIDILSLSNRSTNALKHANIKTIEQLLDFPVDDLGTIKNMGAKSVSEVGAIILSLKQGTNEDFCVSNSNDAENNAAIEEASEEELLYAEEMAAAFGNDQSFWIREIHSATKNYGGNSNSVLLYWIYKNPIIRSTVKAKIVLATEAKEECDYEDIFSCCPNHLHNTSVLKEILTELEVERSISVSEGIAVRIYPSVVQFANLIKIDRSRDMFIARLNGLTLEEIGHRYGITRERTRQVLEKELRKKPRFEEDKYLYLFENYDFSKEDFTLAFNEEETTFYYLEMVSGVSKQGKKPISALLEDTSVSVRLRKLAEKAVYKEYVTIDGARVKKQRAELVDYYIKTRCLELTKYSDFVEEYHNFLIEYSLYENDGLHLESRTYENKLNQSELVLWNQGHSFRYYNIAEKDFEHLLSAIDLKQYKNKEISTMKLFREYPELMKEYDIRDEYELHNLLKKVWFDTDTEIVFKKMPTVVIGNADRDNQVLELLLKYAPISVDSLAKEYELEYGAKAATVMGTYLRNFDEYFFNGVYSIYADNLPVDRFNVMKELLQEDFYFIPEIKEIYLREFPEAAENDINPYTLKTLGLNVFSGYVTSSAFPTSASYFNKILTDKDFIDINDFKVGIASTVSFNSELYDLREKRVIVEYEPRKLISSKKLGELGATEDKIIEYCNAVEKFARDKEFFTIKSLKEDGFAHDLDQLGFDDWFYGSLLIESREQFSYKRIGRTRVFAIGTPEVSITKMIEWIVMYYKRIALKSLNRVLENRYGLFLKKDKLLSIIKASTLYYDPIMEDVYSSYGEYTM